MLKNTSFIQQSSYKTRCFRISCPSTISTENGCVGPDQRLSLRSILFPTVAINGCPKEENKNRLSIYNTPACLYLYTYIFPPCFHLQSFPAHWPPDVVSACSVAISWFLFHQFVHSPRSDVNFQHPQFPLTTSCNTFTKNHLLLLFNLALIDFLWRPQVLVSEGNEQSPSSLSHLIAQTSVTSPLPIYLAEEF